VREQKELITQLQLQGSHYRPQLANARRSFTKQAGNDSQPAEGGGTALLDDHQSGGENIVPHGTCAHPGCKKPCAPGSKFCEEHQPAKARAAAWYAKAIAADLAVAVETLDKICPPCAAAVRAKGWKAIK